MSRSRPRIPVFVGRHCCFLHELELGVGRYGTVCRITALSKPYRRFFREKYHTGVLQAQYGPECTPNYLKRCAVALFRERDFQLKMHQKPFIGWVPVGPVGEANSAPQTSRLRVGEETPGTGNACKRKVEKGEWKERRMVNEKGGKGDKVPYRHFFFPLPAMT